MKLRTELPGPRRPAGAEDPRFLPHVLVVADPGDGSEKEWEVEHHADCPRECPWWPDRDCDKTIRSPRDVAAAGEPEWRHDCYVQWEIDGNGIDSLQVVMYRELGPGGAWRDVAPHADPDYVPATPFEAEWTRLRPGRYLIEGWYTPPHWAGEYVDADGGLTLVSLEPPPKTRK